MKAVLFSEVGKSVAVTDSFEIGETSLAVVELTHSALNHRDVWITKGMYPGIRPQVVLGSDGVGTYQGQRVVINPGISWGNREDVQSEGFHVLGMPDHGTFAEQIAIDQSQIHVAPQHLSDEEAAALPLAGVTAYRTLFSRCKAKPAEKVLVTGSGGGVALMAVQLAVAAGCEVYVTSGNEEKLEKAKSLGATAGANYKKQEWSKELMAISDGGFDVVIDSAGGEGFGALVKMCRPGARVGFYGAGQGKWPSLHAQLLFWRQVSILGSTMGSPSDFKDMLSFVTEHKIRPVVDKVFSLSDAQHSFEYMESGQQFGKLVLQH